MKNALLATLLFSLFSQVSVAQNATNNFSIGLNLFRYAPASSHYYYLTGGLSEASWVNGWDFAYQQNSRIGYFASFRSSSSQIDAPGIDWFDKYNTKGIEVCVGPTISSREFHRFRLSFSLAVFGEFAKVKGYVDKGDFTGIYEVNHTKNYYGLAPALEVNFRISERISLFAKTRYRAGKVAYKGTKPSSPFGNPLLEDHYYNCYQYEPLSDVGFRVHF